MVLRYKDSVSKIHQAASDLGKDLGDFSWAYFPYISIYPTEQEAAEIAARQLGGQYLYSGEFINIVRDYCLLGPVSACIERMKEYIDAGSEFLFLA